MHYENLDNSLFEHRTNIYNLNNNLCCEEESNCTCSNDFNVSLPKITLIIGIKL